MVKQILEGLIPPFASLMERSPKNWIVDCTLGGGGHTAAFLEALRLLPEGKNHHGVIAIDQDLDAIRRAEKRFAQEIADKRLELHHMPFGEAAFLLKERPVLGLLADLGFSSDQ